MVFTKPRSLGEQRTSSEMSSDKVIDRPKLVSRVEERGREEVRPLPASLVCDSCFPRSSTSKRTRKSEFRKVPPTQDKLHYTVLQFRNHGLLNP